MASTAHIMASAIANLLVGKIASFLEDEVSLLTSARRELKEVKQELISMESFFEDADKLEELSAQEKIWVASVREIAFDVEDIVDEYMYFVDRPRWTWKCFRRTIYIPKNLMERHRMATKLEKINKRIKLIPERSRRYGVGMLQGTTSIQQSNWVQNRRESSIFVKDEEIVGIKDAKQKIVKWLLDGTNTHQTIITVLGMGGSGKTTLVAKSVNTRAVEECFECMAWITVSKSYVVEDIFRNLIKEFYKVTKQQTPEYLRSMRYKELVETLVNYLRQKTYLVVLDDVWDENLWKQISLALPNGDCGSRVVVTTRDEKVACFPFAFGVGAHVHRIIPLQKNDAWSLFSMKAFPGTASSCNECPTDLKPVADDLIRKCGGLPLAIVTLGGLMASKRLELEEWNGVLRSLGSESSNVTELEVMKKILLLSFIDLSYRLKHCFLYCCAFPEDSLLLRGRLIGLWIGEGFVKDHREGERHIMELTDRSMLQAVDRDSRGVPMVCKMQDLLREFLLPILKREKFCAMYDGTSGLDEECRGARRLSIQANPDKLLDLVKGKKVLRKIRSLFVFYTNGTGDFSLDPILRDCRLLRVLDLQDCACSIENFLAKQPVKLFNLRYLNLRGTKMERLPESIQELHHLISLNIGGTQIKVLPEGVAKLQNLQHLVMGGTSVGTDRGIFNYFYGVGAPSKSNIGNLKNLQILYHVQATGGMTKKLGSMTQLTILGVTGLVGEDEEDLCASIGNMSLLRLLNLKTSNEEEVLRMDALSAPPSQLDELFLTGKLEKMPEWIKSLRSLRRLDLKWSRLREDHDLLPHIQALPLLCELVLVNACQGKKLQFLASSGRMIRLECVWIEKLGEMEEMVVEKGVMPGLRFMSIRECKELKTIPRGIEHLTTLQVLELEDVGDEIIQGIEGGGEESKRVRHISTIKHFFPNH